MKALSTAVYMNRLPRLAHIGTWVDQPVMIRKLPSVGPLCVF